MLQSDPEKTRRLLNVVTRAKGASPAFVLLFVYLKWLCTDRVCLKSVQPLCLIEFMLRKSAATLFNQTCLESVKPLCFIRVCIKSVELLRFGEVRIERVRLFSSNTHA